MRFPLHPSCQFNCYIHCDWCAMKIFINSSGDMTPDTKPCIMIKTKRFCDPCLVKLSTRPLHKTCGKDCFVSCPDCGVKIMNNSVGEITSNSKPCAMMKNIHRCRPCLEKMRKAWKKGANKTTHIISGAVFDNKGNYIGEGDIMDHFILQRD